MSAYPLAIFGIIASGDMERIRAAKAALALSFVVQPVPAVPGGPVRVLALRERPNFLCDHALVADPMNPDAMLAALRWVLDDSFVDPRATTRDEMMLPWLRSVLGEGVRELEPETHLGWDDPA